VQDVPILDDPIWHHVRVAEDDTDSGWPSWDHWLLTLSDADRSRALALRDRFAELGANDPEGWARSEVAEDFAQFARYILLKGVSTRVLARFDQPRWIDQALLYSPSLREAVEQIRAADVPDNAIAAVAAYIAQDVAFSILNYLDDGYNADIDDEDLPGWRVMEVVEDPETGASYLTGRDVGGLHESIFDVHGGD
jgi:hypothetical protein